MNKYLFILLLLSVTVTVCSGQKHYSKSGRIHFLSQAPLEKIEATNKSAYVILDTGNGQMEWSVLIKGFEFAKALMQDHFNENYMESSQFPKAIFKGTVVNMKDVKLEKDGVYPVNVKGNLTIHGVTKPFITSGHVTVKAGKVSMSSSFDVVVADFNIEIPKVVRDNIAKTVKVTVSSDLQPMN